MVSMILHRKVDDLGSSIYSGFASIKRSLPDYRTVFSLPVAIYASSYCSIKDPQEDASGSHFCHNIIILQNNLLEMSLDDEDELP